MQQHLRRAFVAPALAASIAATALVGTTGSPATADALVTIDHDDFTSLDGLALVGDAAQVGDVLRLTEPNVSVNGGVWSTERIDADEDFAAEFAFEFHDAANPPYAADGLAFVVHTDERGTEALGEEGGLLGYGGYDGFGNPKIQPSFATTITDFTQDEVAFRTGGVVYNPSAPASWSRVLSGSTLYGNGPVHAWVDYVASTDRMRLYLSATATKPTTPVLDATVDLDAAVTDGPAVVGITAATGGFNQVTDLLSWHLESGPGVVQEPVVATPTQVRIDPAGSASYGAPLVVRVKTDPVGGPKPTGTVTLTDGDTTIASGTLTKGRLTVPAASSLAVGDHHLVATYTPADAEEFEPSSVEHDLTVTKANSTISFTAKPASAAVGQRVALTATVGVMGAPAAPSPGTVTFATDQGVLGQAEVKPGNRRARLNVKFTAPGPVMVYAEYAGSTNAYGAGTAIVVQVTS